MFKQTKILTLIGYVSIENLTPSDFCISPFTMQPVKIKRLVKRKVDWDTLGDTNKPMLIKAGTFGEVPIKDVYMSGHHRLLFSDVVQRSVPTEVIGIQAFKVPQLKSAFLSRDQVLERIKACDESDLYYYNVELESTVGMIAFGLSIETFQPT